MTLAVVCWGGEGPLVVFANLYAVNAPATASCKLPTGFPRTEVRRDAPLGSWDKVQAGPSSPLACYILPFYFPVSNYKWNYLV